MRVLYLKDWLLELAFKEVCKSYNNRISIHLIESCSAGDWISEQCFKNIAGYIIFPVGGDKWVIESFTTDLLQKTDSFKDKT